MRVLQAMAGAPKGGAELFFERLVIGLARRGVDQVVAIRGEPERAARLRAAGIAPVELAFGGPLDPWTPLRLRILAARTRPDVALTFMNRASATLPDGPFPHIGRIGHYYKLKYYKSCDHLIGITPDLVDYMRRAGWPKERTHYIPNFVVATPAPALPRTSFDTPDGVPLLLAYGRLHKNKGFDTLIRALAAVPEAHLWLAGDGPERAALIALAGETGVAPRLHLLGWRDDIPALAATADALVFPSRSEGFGSVIFEAWAHGIPIVATAAEGPAQYIRHGENGFLVPIDDHERLASDIRTLLASPDDAKTMIERARAEYAASYTEEAVLGRYVEVLETAIRMPRKA